MVLSGKALPIYLQRLFQVIITGDDVKIGKPDPEPFLRALDTLGIVADEAVVVENAPCGIQSAKAAGITCLAIETSLPRSYLQDADYVFSSIKELSEKIVFIPARKAA